MGDPIYANNRILAAFKRTLYRGRAWPRGTDTVMHATLSGFMPAAGRFMAASAAMLADVFPATATSVLDEWEDTLGLPDPCAGTSPTIEARRAQVVARLADSGGASKDYFIAFAKTLGFDITITEFAPSRYGKTYGGTYGGDDWAHTWQVNIPGFTVCKRQYGDVYGEPYATWGSTVIQCEFLTRKPAHTALLFSYGPDGAPAPVNQFRLDINTLA